MSVDLIRNQALELSLFCKSVLTEVQNDHLSIERVNTLINLIQHRADIFRSDFNSSKDKIFTPKTSNQRVTNLLKLNIITYLKIIVNDCTTLGSVSIDYLFEASKSNEERITNHFKPVVSYLLDSITKAADAVDGNLIIFSELANIKIKNISLKPIKCSYLNSSEEKSEESEDNSRQWDIAEESPKPTKKEARRRRTPVREESRELARRRVSRERRSRDDSSSD